MITSARILRTLALAALVLPLSACLQTPTSEPTPFDPATAKVEVRVLTAKWCHMCHGVPDMLVKLRKDFPTVEFREYDIDDPANAKMQTEYNADAVPFFAIVADGKLVGRVRGLMEYDAFAAYLRKTMAGGR
jgi:glutaredoxin